MKINYALMELLKEKKLKLSTAESITGGKIISDLIEVPGASQVIEQSYVVYSDKAKENVLGVDSKLIEAFGVVSEEVAIDMARKTKELTKADIVITTTGEAGPNPNSKDVTVGTVCFGLIIKEEESTLVTFFAGDRQGIISNAVTYILNHLYYKLK